jgi:hypothetical protein
MVTKANITIGDSFFYRDLKVTDSPNIYTVKYEDLQDPGRIALSVGYDFDLWPIILRYNGIVDPIDGMFSGMKIFIPTQTELKNIRLKLR